MSYDQPQNHCILSYERIIAKQTGLNPRICLYYPLDGSLAITTNHETVTVYPHDLFVMNAGVCYDYQPSASKECLLFCLEIPLGILSTGQALPSFDCNTGRNFKPTDAALRNAVTALLPEQALRRVFLSTSDENLRLLLNLLITHYLSDPERLSEDGDRMYDERLQEALLMILEDCSHAPSLEDLADSLHISYTYLSRYFKKILGISFKKYISQMCLYQAARSLIETDASVLQAAFSSGFSNLNVFGNTFAAAYGCTPTEYRTRMRAQKKEDQKILSQFLEEHKDTLGLAPAKPVPKAEPAFTAEPVPKAETTFTAEPAPEVQKFTASGEATDEIRKTLYAAIEKLSPDDLRLLAELASRLT